MATSDEIISRFPKLYHMAEGGSWPSVLEHGLLSTTALLDLFEISGPRRTAIESEWRPESIEITHPIHGRAIVRDQGPMPPRTLAPVLIDMSPSDWYRLVNRKTFFWLGLNRLDRFLNAAPYRQKVHDVIIVDTRAMFRYNAAQITLASFNTGVSSFGPRFMRGKTTFRSIEEFPLGAGSGAPVELAVDYRVTDLDRIALAVEQRRGRSLVGTVWER